MLDVDEMEGYGINSEKKLTSHAQAQSISVDVASSKEIVFVAVDGTTVSCFYF